MTDVTPIARPRRRLGGVTRAALLLGAALSAFFDGILLHQVFQWHHLLSLADGATWRDLENQLLADGLFHMGVYAVTLAGLLLLWRARAELLHPNAGRRIVAALLVGFGLWNLADIVGVHWLAGLHRVRVDVADPLPWDLGWLAAFGVVPLLVGIGVWGRSGGSASGRPTAILASLAVLVLGGGAVAPVAAGTGAVVVFQPGVSPAQAFAAVRGTRAVAWWTCHPQPAR